MARLHGSGPTAASFAKLNNIKNQLARIYRKFKLMTTTQASSNRALSERCFITDVDISVTVRLVTTYVSWHLKGARYVRLRFIA
jgi:hypothetical protein